MKKKYVITMLCTDTDNTYYNDIIEQEFETRESAMECIDKCIEEEKLSLTGVKVVVKEHRNGKQVWAYGICLTDYEIREIRGR